MNILASIVLFVIALVIVYFIQKPVLRFVRSIIPTGEIKSDRGRKLANAAVTSFTYNALMLIIVSLFGLPYHFVLFFCIVLIVECFRAKD